MRRPRPCADRSRSRDRARTPAPRRPRRRSPRRSTASQLRACPGDPGRRSPSRGCSPPRPTSTPPASSAANALEGARNVNSFGAGEPRSVTAVSRFTTAMSARRSVDPIAPSTVDGDDASRSRIGLSKWMSPPKANVTGSPLPRRPRVLCGVLTGAGGKGLRLRGRVVAGGCGVAVRSAAPRDATAAIPSPASAIVTTAVTCRRRAARARRRRRSSR